MTPAAWISLGIGLLSVICSGLSVFIAVRISTAVHDQRLKSLEVEVIRLRDSLHDFKTDISPLLVYAQMFKEHLDRERSKH